jgi:hypothetical protein
MIVSQCFWAELRRGVLSCCHLDFHRQIVGDGVYCGPVTIAHRSPKQLYKWVSAVEMHGRLLGNAGLL